MLFSIAAIAIVLFLASTRARAGWFLVVGPAVGSLASRRLRMPPVLGGMLGGVVGGMSFCSACYLHVYLHPSPHMVDYLGPVFSLFVCSALGLAFGLVVGVVAWAASDGWTMWRRRADCLARARQFEASAAAHRDLAAIELALHCAPRAAGHREMERRLIRSADRHRRVARYPWLPMPSEPPPPEP